jgi:hypothetical protein
MPKYIDNSEQEPGSLPTETPRPRSNFAVYVLVIVLLYIGNMISGVWFLYYGLGSTTGDLVATSILNWIGAWILCYFAYRRSHTFGYVLLTLTVVLTVLIVAAVLLVAFFFGVLGDA